jgi:hypothetical protein
MESPIVKKGRAKMEGVERDVQQSALRSRYAKRYDLPVQAITVLQSLEILPEELLPLDAAGVEDLDFLERLAKAWCTNDIILGGLHRLTAADRQAITEPEPDRRQEWQKYVEAQYYRAYRESYLPDDETLPIYHNITLCTRRIYEHLSLEFAMPITSTIREEVGAIRRTVKKRVYREVDCCWR